MVQADPTPCAAAKGSREWFAARGFEKPVGKQHANLWQQITFNWAAPLLSKGARQEIREDIAEAFVDDQNGAPFQARIFEEAYEKLKVRLSCSTVPSLAGISTRMSECFMHMLCSLS